MCLTYDSVYTIPYLIVNKRVHVMNLHEAPLAVVYLYPEKKNDNIIIKPLCL